ncbi:hypothetical protein AKJ66_00370 [candidate division MSBL1 archaeon SCGC-AAA259E22]|uniref:ArnR1-like winged helix-turn-helix domain-containing protein n=1 Tax=candidate division MSBL1 archaeon SCGC-AAA259E22 TaxID=1698265 RepID=A0A133UI96_9EURY|nr:hypothetical protein AKJ66_00370 [candidate division MSBL1 archaeon SCGC-AAA259E22]
MRLSKQMKKIMLVLKNEEEKREKKPHLRVKNFARKIYGDEAFYTPSWSYKEQVTNSRSVSLNRSLDRLAEEGLVVKLDNYVGIRYDLSPKGMDKATEIESEIKSYIREWTSFIEED